MKHLVLVITLMMGSLGFAKSGGATYEVPGASEAEEALFDMAFKIDFDGDAVSVGFNLPELLTGIPNRIEAQGTMLTPNMALLKGPKGHLACDIPNEVCNVVYKNLETDLNVLQQNLQKSGLSAVQINSRLEVARRFIQDPEGIIRYGKNH